MGSLEFTDLKQFRDNALVYINHETLIFFIELEQLRVTLLCQAKLNIFKSDLFTMAVSTVKQNKNLLDQWTYLKDVAVTICSKICFVKLLASIFIWDVDSFLEILRDHNINQTEAHRKRVVERKAAKQQKDDKVTIQSLSEDQS